MIIIEKYYINLPSGMFGIAYKNKQQAIEVFKKEIETEINMKDSKYWNEHGKKYQKLINEGKVEVVTIRQEIKETVSREILK